MPLATRKALAIIEKLTGSTDPLVIIRLAATNGNRVMITYKRKRDDTVVKREIRPYEDAGRLIYATDTAHGAGVIHSFLKSRILNAKTVKDSRFERKWRVKF